MRRDPFQTDQRIPKVDADRYFTDREDAIGAFQRAISTPTGQPLHALVFYGVGGVGKTLFDLCLSVMLEREGGDPPPLVQALAHFEAALRVHTEDDFPREWARIQGNLGVAYHALRDGDLEANLRRSVASYDAALRVYSPDDYFVEWAETTRGLAGALLALGQMTGDVAAQRRARVRVATLRQGLASAGMPDDADGLAEAQAEIDAAIDALPPSGAG